MIWSMLFNAFLFAFFYSRLARCDSRAVQVVFSKKAIVSIDRTSQQVRFQVRVYDVDSRHPVVEAHARLYAVRKDRPVPRPLRILQPNDELGAMLFLSMPTVIHHHVDVYSMLHPPPPPLASSISAAGKDIPRSSSSAGLSLRQVDSVAHGREEIECPVCANAFATSEALQRHIRYLQVAERQENYPVEHTHLSLPDATQPQEQPALDALTARFSPIVDLERLRAYFEAELSEIICVVEGLDPLSSGTFQSLQSYRFEDIVWEEHAIFHPCVTVANNRKRGDYYRVNLSRFHQVDLVAPPQGFDFPAKALRTHDSWMVLDDEEEDNVGADDGNDKTIRVNIPAGPMSTPPRPAAPPPPSCLEFTAVVTRRHHHHNAVAPEPKAPDPAASAAAAAAPAPSPLVGAASGEQQQHHRRTKSTPLPHPYDAENCATTRIQMPSSPLPTWA